MSYFHFQIYGSLHYLLLDLFPLQMARSSYLEVFCKKDIFKNFTKFKGKHRYRSLFFNKVPGFQPAILLKRDSSAGVSMWILWNCEKYSFFRPSANGCFKMVFWNSSFDKKTNHYPWRIIAFPEENVLRLYS